MQILPTFSRASMQIVKQVMDDGLTSNGVLLPEDDMSKSCNDDNKSFGAGNFVDTTPGVYWLPAADNDSPDNTMDFELIEQRPDMVPFRVGASDIFVSVTPVPSYNV